MARSEGFAGRECVMYLHVPITPAIDSGQNTITILQEAPHCKLKHTNAWKKQIQNQNQPKKSPHHPPPKKNLWGLNPLEFIIISSCAFRLLNDEFDYIIHISVTNLLILICIL